MLFAVATIATLAASTIPDRAVADDTAGDVYEILYELTPDPAAGTFAVRMVLEQEKHLLREVRMPAGRISGVSGDGSIERDGDDIVWTPPEPGGAIEWQANARLERNGGGYDAWLDEEWGLLRTEDLIPRASTRALRGARSNTAMRFHLPGNWSVVSEYRAEPGVIPVTPDGRLFTQPAGWLVLGELGVRREEIAGSKVAIAAPTGEDVRRMDMLALLNWTLPELARVLPGMPPRITVFSAGEPMWRGGLSAPQSLYMHADRPLLSENGTSTLLHEVMHVSMRRSARPGYDWIVEGMAEYYSLELLRRSGGITLPRFRAALDDLRAWAKDAKALCDGASSGAETALAVTVLHALNEEIRKATDAEHNLDDVLHGMLKRDERFSLDLLTSVTTDVMGKKPDTIRRDRLSGCSKFD